VLKKIRRMLALQALMLSAVLWYGWKNREAIERAVRAARAAWDAPKGPADDDMVVAVVVNEQQRVGGPIATAGTPSF
jgi:hypothetical protein